MKITIAKHHGFCFGVKRAVDLAMNLKEKANTFGHLVHNQQLIERLKQNGITPIDTIQEINQKTVIIRAHGIPNRTMAELKSKSLNIIDATCPFVKKVQEKAVELENQGFQVVILGEKDHPEVLAIASNIKKPIIVLTEAEAKVLPYFERMALISQTTQTKDLFERVAKILKTKTCKLRKEDTICSATPERQSAAVELARTVDLMIVIGGYDSGNTKRLRELCSEIVETRHIETEHELKKEWFNNKNHIGITAGASTPDWVINAVVEKINNEF